MIRGRTTPFRSGLATPRSPFKPSWNTPRIAPSTEVAVGDKPTMAAALACRALGYPAIQLRLSKPVVTSLKQGNYFRRQVCLSLDSPLTQLIQMEAESPGRFAIRVLKPLPFGKSGGGFAQTRLMSSRRLSKDCPPLEKPRGTSKTRENALSNSGRRRYRRPGSRSGRDVTPRTTEGSSPLRQAKSDGRSLLRRDSLCHSVPT